MTNAPDTRKTHVIRILGTNRNGDVLLDTWADVERIDVAKSATKDSKGFWQGGQRKQRWMDDPASDDYEPDGNPARELEILKVCDPENTADVNDPDEWIPIPVIRSIKSKQGDTGTQDRQRNNGPDDSGDLNLARISEPRRIYHYDTSIDSAADAAFAADPTLKAYVVPGDSYTRDDASRDTGQYVEHEVITFLKAKGNDGDVDSRGQQIKLLNQYLIDESDPAKLDIVGRDGINPPYRPDPFQNIINVKFSSTVIVAFVSGATSVTLTSEQATLLAHRTITGTGTPADGLDAFFVKVKASLNGTFASVGLSGSPGELGIGFPTLFTVVCPKKSTDSASVDAAIATIAQLFANMASDFTVTAAPDGLMFYTLFQGLPGGVLPWNIASVNHRPDDPSNPIPNRMVQCFPLSVTPNTFFDPGSFGSPTFTTTYLGFQILAYRLDAKGTGKAYAVKYPEPGFGMPGNPSQWGGSKVRILASSLGTNGFDYGVTFPASGKLPLITADVPL